MTFLYPVAEGGNRTRQNHLRSVDGFFSPFQRSHAAFFEALALKYGAELRSLPISVHGDQVGVRMSFERRFYGVSVRFLQGIVLMRSSATREGAVTKFQDMFGDLDSVDLATFCIAGPSALDSALELTAQHAGRFLLIPERAINREVLPIGCNYTNFLQRLGSHTRRNLRNCRRNAAKGSLIFRFGGLGEVWHKPELQILGNRNMPFPTMPRILAIYDRLLSTRQRPYQACLTAPDGRLISATGGYIEADLAFMFYQLNSRDHRNMSPSLTMRSFLIEHLIKLGVQKLAFTGGCAGLLNNVCEPSAVLNVNLVRDALGPRLKFFASALAGPDSIAGRFRASARRPRNPDA
jgi:hypothetical protein